MKEKKEFIVTGMYLVVFSSQLEKVLKKIFSVVGVLGRLTLISSVVFKEN